MRRYLLGVAASALALVGLAGSPSLAKADHHDGHREYHAWYRGHHNWDRDGYPWRGYYRPYPSSYAVPYSVYSYPYPVPYPVYVYPDSGFGYQGPNFSFWLGR
jgi:hypothetical protein